MLRIMPGYEFNISAKSYYDGDFVDQGSIDPGDVTASLMSTLLGGGTYGGTPVGEMADNTALIGSIFSKPALAGQIAGLDITDEDPNAPKAYLNYLFFDDKMKLVPGASGKVQIKANIGPGTWGTVRPSNNPSLTVKCNVCPPFSSAVIYVDNQSIGKEVWFDNLFVDHYNSDVLEENHYYPFGLTRTFDLGNAQVGQPYKLTTKELERSFGMEMYDFGARLQDPQLGRWFGVDELSEKYYTHSPYTYVMNRPTVALDNDGRKVTMTFNKDTKSLTIMDLDHYKKGLENKFVSASEYKQGGLRDKNGNLTANQVLVVKDVFSGGETTGKGREVETNLKSDRDQLPIPNGSYDLTERGGKLDFYRLDPIDNDRYDDQDDRPGIENADGDKRTAYRLHLGNLSHGCVTVADPEHDRGDEWGVIKTILNNTSTEEVPKREGNQRYIPFTTRTKYGEIKVIGTDKIKD